MKLKLKKSKLNSITQLIPLLKDFPEEQNKGIEERIILKKQIQSKCKHEFINAGSTDFCYKCSKIKLT